MQKSRTSFGTLIAAMLGMSAGVALPINANPPAMPRGKRISKKNAAGMYGRGLRAAWDRQREQAQRLKHPNRPNDEAGAYTLTGRGPNGERRKWVAGISARR